MRVVAFILGAIFAGILCIGTSNCTEIHVDEKWTLVADSKLVRAEVALTNDGGISGQYVWWDLQFENGLKLIYKADKDRPMWVGKWYVVYWDDIKKTTKLELKK